MEEGQSSETGIFYTQTPPHSGQCCVVLGAGNVRAHARAPPAMHMTLTRVCRWAC